MGKVLKKGAFDIEAFRRERARKAALGGVDLVSALNQIAPDIEKLKVGETAQLDIPEGKKGLRKFVMSITAKLANLTPKGGDWEGRTFHVVSDGEATLYVQRGEDDPNPKARKKASGGGRPRKNATADTGAAGISKANSGALVEEHA
jgi:hypothetical protein